MGVWTILSKIIVGHGVETRRATCSECSWRTYGDGNVDDNETWVAIDSKGGGEETGADAPSCRSKDYVCISRDGYDATEEGVPLGG